MLTKRNSHSSRTAWRPFCKSSSSDDSKSEHTSKSTELQAFDCIASSCATQAIRSHRIESTIAHSRTSLPHPASITAGVMHVTSSHLNRLISRLLGKHIVVPTQTRLNCNCNSSITAAAAGDAYRRSDSTNWKDNVVLCLSAAHLSDNSKRANDSVVNHPRSSPRWERMASL